MTNKDFFTKNGYCIVKSAVNPELRDFITQYALFDEMQNFNNKDKQVPNAHSKYADPCMETFLLNLQKQVEENTGLILEPTYSYYRIYRNGDTLEPHTDRPSCEISATVCFNYSYDDAKFTWPIFMEGNEVNLKPGDMVIYKGCELSHWRNKFDNVLDKNTWHVQGFFHYVNATGPFKDYKFDKRNSIGELKEQIRNNSNKSYITYTK
jgi:hypothetical protein